MRIIFVRHGEPDYAHDSLTEKGWREARLLAERISKWNVTEFYCSPLGRARDTASPTLEKLHRQAVTLDWMQEFTYLIDDPITGRHKIPWDFVPSFWSSDPRMMDAEHWIQADVMKQNPQIATQFKQICTSMDALLASYGYVREHHFYRMPDAPERFIPRTVAPDDVEVLELPENKEEPVIVIFCHLGITCVVLSHLLNIPFPLLVHGIFLPTSSLTILSSEERWSNEAYFRAQAIGDVNHLLSAGEAISSAGSFTEAFQG